MAITIYHVYADINRYVGFRATHNHLFDELYKEICGGISLATKWQPERRIDIIEGRVGDFADGPVHFADISVSDSALDKIRPLVADICELLPYSYDKRKYWALYIPWPTDCLDWEKSSFYFDRRTIADLQDVAFTCEHLNRNQVLFRVPSRFKYYCTQEFKDSVEAAGLTGLAFRFVWSSDGSVPKKRTLPATTKYARMIKSRRRPTKRDLLLKRLWEAIDSFGSDEWLASTMSVTSEGLEGVQEVIAADTEVLNDAAKRGVSPKDLQRLCRSIAYKAVFETLVSIEEECLDRSPALKCLHEDLLMADPRK